MDPMQLSRCRFTSTSSPLMCLAAMPRRAIALLLAHRVLPRCISTTHCHSVCTTAVHRPKPRRLLGQVCINRLLVQPAGWTFSGKVGFPRVCYVLECPLLLHNCLQSSFWGLQTQPRVGNAELHLGSPRPRWYEYNDSSGDLSRDNNMTQRHCGIPASFELCLPLRQTKLIYCNCTTD